MAMAWWSSSRSRMRPLFASWLGLVASGCAAGGSTPSGVDASVIGPDAAPPCTVLDEACTDPTMPCPLATHLSLPNGIAVDATSVYWTEGAGSVMKVPIDGGAPVKLASDDGFPLSIAVDATSVYWLSANAGTISRIPLAGGPTQVLAEEQGGLSNIVLLGSYVYYGNSAESTIKRVPAVGGPTEVLASSPIGPNCIAVDETSVYWGNVNLTNSGEVVMKAPIGGGPAVTLATGEPDVNSIALYEGNVYWTTYDPGDVLKVSIDGGEPHVAASNPPGGYPVTVDATGVYYGTGLKNLCDGALYRVPVEGGAATTLGTGELGGPYGIATDATNVYWAILGSGNADGMVVKLAK